MFMRRGESQDNDTGHSTGSIQMTQQDQLRERAATISRENVLWQYQASPGAYHFIRK